MWEKKNNVDTTIGNYGYKLGFEMKNSLVGIPIIKKYKLAITPKGEKIHRRNRRFGKIISQKIKPKTGS